MEIKKSILKKWETLIFAAKAYWIDSIPTGMDDSTFDALEKKAIEEDGFSVRDYVFQTYLVGDRAENKYIEKIKKTKVEGMTMLQALQEFELACGEKIYADLKYDGSSIALYLDPQTGKLQDIVTVGNSNIDSFGIRQYGKLYNLVPHEFPAGIVAIQCEALIDLQNLPSGLDPNKARQKANGIINSRYLQEEVNQYLTLRAYRYYLDTSIPAGASLERMDYRDVLRSFPIISNAYGIKFAPADVFSVDEIPEGYAESYQTMTSTGEFLNDGWVCYNSKGQCLGALKYAGAGSETDGEIVTKVKSIKWTSQTPKGKDSWAANVIIEPVIVRGSTVTKPSAGSVGKLVKNKISPGAVVTIVMAQEVIPQIKDCISPGNGDYMFPQCSCGYQMSEKDIYGSRLKCGNHRCTEREARMTGYLGTLENLIDLDLDIFLVIDGYKWDSKALVPTLLGFAESEADYRYTYGQSAPDGYNNYRETLMSWMNTESRRRNLDLVVESSWEVLVDQVGQRKYGRG